MSNELLLSLTGVAVLALGFVGVCRWMARTADLRLTLFAPYRGDPWPQGVQEEDGVTWKWTATASPTDEPDSDGSATGPTLTEGGGTTVERISIVTVRRPDRSH